MREGRFASINAVITLLAGVARGMEAVHAHKIIHLDLKPENVLLSADNVPWVTDFGLSTSSNLTSQSTSSAGGRGTIYFKASTSYRPAAPQHPCLGNSIRSPHTPNLIERLAARARTYRHPSSSPSRLSFPPRPMSTPSPSSRGWCARASSLTKICNRLRRS